MNSEIEMQDLLVGIHQQLTEVRKALKDEQDRTEAILSRISEVNLRVSVACFFPWSADRNCRETACKINVISHIFSFCFFFWPFFFSIHRNGSRTKWKIAENPMMATTDQVNV